MKQNKPFICRCRTCRNWHVRLMNYAGNILVSEVFDSWHEACKAVCGNWCVEWHESCPHEGARFDEVYA